METSLQTIILLRCEVSRPSLPGVETSRNEGCNSSLRGGWARREGGGGGKGDENNFSVSLHNSKNPRVKSKSHCEYDLSFELVM